MHQPDTEVPCALLVGAPAMLPAAAAPALQLVHVHACCWRMCARGWAGLGVWQVQLQAAHACCQGTVGEAGSGIAGSARAARTAVTHV